jgi:hypothetical protein
MIPTYPGRWNQHGVPKRWLIKFRRRGNSQKTIFYIICGYSYLQAVSRLPASVNGQGIPLNTQTFVETIIINFAANSRLYIEICMITYSLF